MIRQAIRTTYMTDSQGTGFIRAKCEAKAIKVSWNHSMEVGDNHRAAANDLQIQLGWKWEMFNTGCIGHEYYHVEVVK